MATTKKTVEKAPDLPQGMVAYVDGSVRPRNPGYGGYGFHGYVYSDQPPKKGNGNSTNYVTAQGYVEKHTVKDKTQAQEVKPLYYLNGYGSIGNLVTNNVAELCGAVTALQYAHDYEVKEVTIFTDSEQVVKGALHYLPNWERNNWTKADGNPVANQEYWKQLSHNLKVLDQKGTGVTFKWIKGHNGHLGNELADKLAAIGGFKARDGEYINEVDKYEAEGYWTKTPDKHAFLAQRCLYFCTTPGSVVPGQYYLGNHGKDDELIGKRKADGYYSYVELQHPDPAIEILRNKQLKLAQHQDILVLGRLDKLFDAETHADILNYGEVCLYTPFVNKLDLHYLNAEPLTKELKPPRLAIRAIEAVNVLKGVLEQWRSGSHPFQETDITSALYELDAKGQYKLLPAIVTGFTKFNTTVKYGPEAHQALPVELTLGIDLPERNALKKLEKSNPKLTTLTWMESDKMFRYVTVIEAGPDIAIYGGMYSNMRFLFEPQK